MTNKILKIFFVFTLILSLSGCSMLTEYTESEQVVVVSAMGFDIESNVIKISAEIVSQQKNDEAIIITSWGKTAEECIVNLKQTAGVPLILSHCGTVVLGETLGFTQAKEIINFLGSLYEFPLGSYLSSSQNALSLLKSKSISEEQNGYTIMRILKQNNKDSRLFTILRKDEISLPQFEVRNENYYLKDDLWTLR